MSNSGPAVWVEQTRVHAFDVDATHHVSIETVCRLFLEVAWDHAEALGVGFEALLQEGKVWVLSRMLLEFHSLPRWREQIALRTWPRPSRSAFAMRDFQMLDDEGGVLVAGSSAWLMLDAESRRPLRSDKLLAGLEGLCETLATSREPGKLGDFAIGSEGITLHARYSDLDVNGHMNSGRYVGYLMDSYAAGFFKQHRPVSLEINYLAEVYQGDGLVLGTVVEDDLAWRHSLRKASGQEVCRAEVRWKR